MMLPILFVLFAAQGALCVSSVVVNQYAIDSVSVPVETSTGLVTPYLVESAWELIDEGDVNIYILTIQQIQKELLASADASAQALGLCQLVSVIGELASSRCGDACAFAGIINSGDVSNWLARINYDIDSIVALAGNDLSLASASGPVGSCVGGGYSYNYNVPWDSLLTKCSPSVIGLVNEEYCAVGRLHKARNAQSKLVGAAVTACACDLALDVFKSSIPAVANFLRAVATNVNVAEAAATAKASLALASVSL